MTPTDRHKQSLFIFRRDLRLDDNTGLNAALRESDKVIPTFIFDPRQCEPHPYRSQNALQFMIASLRELDAELSRHDTTLHVFYGDPTIVLHELLKSGAFNAVYINRDYTPFSRKRDEALYQVCTQHNIPLIITADALLHEPEEVLKADGTPYTIFTPFWHRASALPVRTPERSPEKHGGQGHYAGARLAGEVTDKEQLYKKLLPKANNDIFLRGGRAEGLSILKGISRLKKYATQRDIPGANGTSGLSAHLKFGTISVREAYGAVAKTLGPSHPLLRQFYWRDFFTHIAHHHPRVFGHAFNERYDKILWADNPSAFAAWKEGRTGFPIVDAGMRELLATGYMHNRVRMIVASFLVKDLHIDWREGERFFAQHLVDYDPCINNGNWQWAASTGCDAQPYFRIFNPWLQQERFDPDCEYIKKWIPELRNLTAKAIHGLATQRPLDSKYPLPIVDHSIESMKAKAMFAGVKSDHA